MVANFQNCMVITCSKVSPMVEYFVPHNTAECSNTIPNIEIHLIVSTKSKFFFTGAVSFFTSISIKYVLVDDRQISVKKKSPELIRDSFNIYVCKILQFSSYFYLFVSLYDIANFDVVKVLDI